MKCKTAGIKVIMCTGDNLDTAIAISKDAGIVTEAEAEGEFASYTCTEGKSFRKKVGEELIVEKEKYKDDKGKEREKIISESVKNMNEFRIFHQHLRVLARSSPLDKRILVTGIQ